MSWRQRWRRLSLGLQTLTGWRERGFFIPYRYAQTVRADRHAGTPALYPLLNARFEAQSAAFTGFLERLNGYGEALKAIGEDASAPEPRWRQDWFPGLDAAALYTMIRANKPARIVEIGAGHSTRFMLRAIADEGISPEVTIIDPSPRAEFRQAFDAQGIALDWHASTLKPYHLEALAEMAPGDVVSVDSSHILMPGSDVEMVLTDGLPRLITGALIHIHDMFLPYDYPAAWHWRGYNEQSAVAALLASDAYEVLWSSVWMRSHAARLNFTLPALAVPEDAHETSLWLRKP